MHWTTGMVYTAGYSCWLSFKSENIIGWRLFHVQVFRPNLCACCWCLYHAQTPEIFTFNNKIYTSGCKLNSSTEPKLCTLGNAFFIIRINFSSFQISCLLIFFAREIDMILYSTLITALFQCRDNLRLLGNDNDDGKSQGSSRLACWWCWTGAYTAAWRWCGWTSASLRYPQSGFLHSSRQQTYFVQVVFASIQQA